MKVPIPNNASTTFDPFYRYKRDSLVTKQEKHFIVLENLHEIAKQLNTPLKNLISFLNKKLGQQLKPDKNKNSNLIRVKPTNNNLEECIEEYIEKYIICNKCGLPELNENDVCNSCGHSH